MDSKHKFKRFVENSYIRKKTQNLNTYYCHLISRRKLMGLRQFIIKRTVYSLILLLFVLTLNYVIFILMPGNPAELFVPPRGLTQEQHEELLQTFRQNWGLADPPHIQYLKYLRNMLTWQFGNSITMNPGQSIAFQMIQRIPYTVILLGGSISIAIVIGVLLGVMAAHKRGTIFDTASVSSSLLFFSVPTFWMAMIFILIFTSTLGWFPHAGASPYEWALRPPHPLTIITSSPSQSGFLGVTFSINPTDTITFITGYLRHAFLPVLTLVLFHYGGFLLLTRATMLEAITEDYIVTAKAKGLDERTILLKHALKNASLPLITSAALSFGFIFGGAIITETVYSWPGLGRWIFDAMSGPDYFILQAAFYVISVAVILANFIADLLYGVIDPRIRYG